MMITGDCINVKSLVERLDSDFGLFKELARLFFSDSPRLLSNIEEAIKNKNPEKIRKSAHTIKGAVSNFSAERAFIAAFKLENFGKNNELDKVDAAFKDLVAEIEAMREALKLMVEKQGF